MTKHTNNKIMTITYSIKRAHLMFIFYMDLSISLTTNQKIILAWSYFRVPATGSLQSGMNISHQDDQNHAYSHESNAHQGKFIQTDQGQEF